MVDMLKSQNPGRSKRLRVGIHNTENNGKTKIIGWRKSQFWFLGLLVPVVNNSTKTIYSTPYFAFPNTPYFRSEQWSTHQPLNSSSLSLFVPCPKITNPLPNPVPPPLFFTAPIPKSSVGSSSSLSTPSGIGTTSSHQLSSISKTKQNLQQQTNRGKGVQRTGSLTPNVLRLAPVQSLNASSLNTYNLLARRAVNESCAAGLAEIAIQAMS